MKLSALFCLLFIHLAVAVEKEILHCKQSDDKLNLTPLSNMDSNCTKKMRDQIQMELTASMTYLAMGSHFLQYDINRPGFAKFFLESASEERQHAIKLIDYLLMRGELSTKVDQLKELVKNPKPRATVWANGADALKAALKLEMEVTESIRGIITTCEAYNNDYHLVDWLTADFLDEQFKGQRDLAGKISTLAKMMATHGELGEFLYDKNLL